MGRSRSWLLLSATLVLAVAACSGGAGSGSAGTSGNNSASGSTDAPVTLTYVTYGGSYQQAQEKAWIQPYMAAHPNVKIVEESPPDYAKLKAMVESGNVTWDVVIVTSDFGTDKDGPLLEPIDCSVVPCSELNPNLVGKYRVPTIISSFLSAYRTDVFTSQVPQSWADFFDTKTFPGKRGLYKYCCGGVLEAALMADGVSPDKLYPLDVERALRKLDTLGDNAVWWETGAQSMQLLTDKEVAMGMSWDGRVYGVVQQGTPVAAQWNQNLAVADYAVVPKGSKHVAEAMKLIAYMTSKEHNPQLSFYIPYAPTNVQGVAGADPSKKDWLSTTHQDVGSLINDTYYAQNYDALNTRFAAWLQGK